MWSYTSAQFCCPVCCVMPAGTMVRAEEGALGMFIVLALHHARRDVLPVYTDMGHALLILVQIMRVHA